jgi:hypothetical protein
LGYGPVNPFSWLRPPVGQVSSSIVSVLTTPPPELTDEVVLVAPVLCELVVVELPVLAELVVEVVVLELVLCE